MTPNYPKRATLAQLPTPLEPLTRLSKHLGGPELWIKRDDQTGLALGGNKSRKLEFLIADAQAQGCDHLITTGSAQSNHCRQTAAAAARYGMGCSLVLTSEPTTNMQGNLLLNKLLGAHLFWAEGEPANNVMGQVAKQVKSHGRTPYIIPMGGSNVMGAAAYVWAMKELMEQLKEQQLNVDFIVFASGSGGTQAGMVLGAHVYNFRAKILGISVSRSADTLQTQAAALATATATHLGLGTLSVSENIEVNDDYMAPGYGVMTELEREAIELMAQKEGILLDPVYTGRAMGGLIDLIRWGGFTRRQTILFWHTGGAPALFAYGDSLLS